MKTLATAVLVLVSLFAAVMYFVQVDWANSWAIFAAAILAGMLMNIGFFKGQIAPKAMIVFQWTMMGIWIYLSPIWGSIWIGTALLCVYVQTRTLGVSLKQYAMARELYAGLRS